MEATMRKPRRRNCRLSAQLQPRSKKLATQTQREVSSKKLTLRPKSPYIAQSTLSYAMSSCQSSQKDTTYDESAGSNPPPSESQFNSDALAGLAPLRAYIPRGDFPSRAGIFHDLFNSFLLEFIHDQNLQQTSLLPWVNELPRFLVSHCFATICSVHAASMAIYGINRNDISIQGESCRWYARGLRAQQEYLDDLRRGAESGPSVESVASSVLFSYFEMITSASSSGWIQHYTGASALLEQMGPLACQDGIINVLFRTVRANMVRAIIIRCVAVC